MSAEPIRLDVEELARAAVVPYLEAIREALGGALRATGTDANARALVARTFVTGLTELAAELDDQLDGALLVLREDGASFAELGALVGLTGEAVRLRLSKADHRRTVAITKQGAKP